MSASPPSTSSTSGQLVHDRGPVPRVDPRATRALQDRNTHRCQRLLERSAPLRTDDLDWASIPAVPVSGEVIDCLVYMRDVEGFTDRDLVGFTAHRTTVGDPVVRRFLEIWREEEAGHALAIDRFLDAYRARRSDIPERQLPPPAIAPRLECVLSRVGGPVGTLVAAAHMSWGAANELLTLHGYRILARRCADHPVLPHLLARIAAQEARHFSFYALQAEWRLTSSRLARAVLPRMLDRSWTPVGVGDGYKSRAEFDRVLRYLAEGPTGTQVLARMDARFSALPGFGGLRIFQAAS